jgi:hypothetical protein
LGNVIAAEHVHGEPLTYHGRVFGTHVALESVLSQFGSSGGGRRAD